MKKNFYHLAIVLITMCMPQKSWAELWTSGAVNYAYTVGESEASVNPGTVNYVNHRPNFYAGSPSASGSITIHSDFSVKGSEYIVTQIGRYAFYNTKITDVSIPNSVTTIELCAFENCSNLNSVTLPESLAYIGDNAFHNCNITSITIPNTVKEIKSNAFWGCNGLTSVKLPDSLEVIEEGTFYECRNLTNVIIPNTVKIIEHNAFAYCSSLTSITIPSSVTSIGYSNSSYVFRTF